MKKTFTIDLIEAITEVTNRLANSVPKTTSDSERLMLAAKGGVTLEEEVDGVTLTVVVRENEACGYAGYPRRTVSVTYGKMVIAYGLSVTMIDGGFHPNALKMIMIPCLGETQEHVDMQKLAVMINQQSAAAAILSGSGMGYLSVPAPVDFKVTLPGDVVFERSGPTVSVTKGEEKLYVLSSTIPQVIEQHMNQAAQVAITHAGSVTQPARTVDTSVDTALLNGVLYVRTGDKSIAYYFDDERNKDFITRQAGQHFAHGIIHDPYLQQNHMFSNMRPGIHNSY